MTACHGVQTLRWEHARCIRLITCMCAPGHVACVLLPCVQLGTSTNERGGFVAWLAAFVRAAVEQQRELQV